MSDASTQPPPRLATPVIVWALAAALVGLYGAYAFQAPAFQELILEQYALLPSRWTQAGGAPGYPSPADAALTLLTHGFLHGGWLHVILNTVVFVSVGRWVALRFAAEGLGAWRIVAIFLASIVGGGLMFLAIEWGRDVAAVGASGGVCGVVGAYFLAARQTPGEALRDRQIQSSALVFLAINVVAMGLLGAPLGMPIAWEAHLGGFLAGAAAYLALLPPSARGQEAR